MKDNLSIAITMLIFVILIVIFPLYNYFERQDNMSYNLVLKSTTNFVDEVLESGYLDQEMYDKYVEQLGSTGNVYNIDLEAHRKILIANANVNNEDVNNEYDEQYLVNYNNDIFTDINNSNSNNINEKQIRNHIYYFNEGDQFYVKIKNSNTTMAGAIFNTIVPTSSKNRIVVNYGGVIKNQAWAKVDATFRDIASIENNLPTVTYKRIEYSGGQELKNKILNNAEVIDAIPEDKKLVFSASGLVTNNWHNNISGYYWGVDGDTNFLGKDSEFKFDLNNREEKEYLITVAGVDVNGNKTDTFTFKINISKSTDVPVDNTGETSENTIIGVGDIFNQEVNIDIKSTNKKIPSKIEFEIYFGDLSCNLDEIYLYSSKLMGSKNYIIDTTYRGLKTEGYYKVNNEGVKYNITKSSDKATEYTEINGIKFKKPVKARKTSINIQFNYDDTITYSDTFLDILSNLKFRYKRKSGIDGNLKATDINGKKWNGIYKYKITYRDY